MDEKCWFFIGFTRLWMKSIDFSLVLQGCGWKVLILRWFYEVVDANCWFLQWLWMTMVVFHWFLCEISPTTDPQPSWLRFGVRSRRSSRSTFASEQPQATESDHAASPRLARSHARTKRNDFPVGVTRTHPPQPPIQKSYKSIIRLFQDLNNFKRP